MLSSDWKRLQNGSDIRGVALEGIKGEEVNLTPEVARTIGSAFGTWLSKKTNKSPNEIRISVGKDSRLSGPQLASSVIHGLTKLGCEVYDCGLSSTPAMFMSTILHGHQYDGAIMLTASHLPFNRNGLKFFTNEGGLEKSDITEILRLAQDEDFTEKTSTGKVVKVDFISEYASYLTEKIRVSVNSSDDYQKPLKGFKVVVDAGNGAGGFFVDKVLKPLGADTKGSQFLEPDGTFPNHIPNPEDETAMEAITKAVLENGADFGIIFDTDVDRAGAVDRNGKEINRNRIIALMSAIVLSEHPNTYIVTDSVTSSELKDFIELKLGGTHHRFKRGYKNVINEAVRLNSLGKESHLAIETSGHGALKENFFLDDGAYLVSKMLIQMAKIKDKGMTIDSLIEDLKDPLEIKEFRMNIKQDNFKEYGAKIIEELNNYAETMDGWDIASDNYEGIRISFNKTNGDGWLLLRLSLHDPLMPLNIESNSQGGVKVITFRLIKFLRKYPELDISTLEAFIS